jgi:O-acetyl-ADP-ribose deacetylase (regulator of RNase III)
MIKYKKSNLLDAFIAKEVNIIGHQCNFCCGLGAGVAKKIAELFPKIASEDYLFRNNVENSIGKILFVEVKENMYIYNLYAQINTYYTQQDTFEKRLSWLKTCLKEMKKTLSFDDRIGFPLMASGLAANQELKGSMSDLDYFKLYIHSIVDEVLGQYNVTIYYL